MDQPKAITFSSSYSRADQDSGFLSRDELRAVRLQLEWLKTELIQQDEGIVSTIVVFGSARLVEPAEAQDCLAQAEQELSRFPQNPVKLQAVSIARAQLALSRYYDEAREFGRLASTLCQDENRCEYVVVTGGGPGIMEAAFHGARMVGIRSLGTV